MFQRDNSAKKEEKIEVEARMRQALETARERLLQQQSFITQLTSPPFVHATVVGLSASHPKINRGPFHGFFGQDIKPDAGVYSRHGFKVGDELEVTKEGLAANLASKGSESNFVVGFIGSGKVVTESDGIAFVDDAEGVKKWYRVSKPSELRESPTAVIIVEGKFLEVLIPAETEIGIGDTVTVNQSTMQIVGLAVTPIDLGNIAVVRRAIDDSMSEVEYSGSMRVVLNGKLFNRPEIGDRVVLDASAMVILRNLGQEEEKFSFTAETNVRWDDIGGLAEAKKQMIEAIELPFLHPEIYRHYGKKPLKGVLLYGPPGCGKTMLGKATATAVADVHGYTKSSGFIYVKGPEVLSKFVSVAEETIRSLFQRSRKHKEDEGYPAVIFIDEADAILGRRGMGISSDIERTIVPAFLAEMDGLEDSGAIVLLATNRADVLDPAVTRDGRIDRKVKITRPDMNGASEIFRLYLEKMPLCNGYTKGELADFTALELYSDKRVIYSVQLNGRHNGQVRNFTLGHLSSGAMVAGIVDRATSYAMYRDIEKGRSPNGLSKDDLERAVEAVFRENFDLNHNDEIADFIYDFRDDVVGIQKLRQGSVPVAK